MSNLKPLDLRQRRQAAPKKKSYRLLYVEDEDLNWEVASKCLGRDCTIDRAANSREAFDKLRTGLYDLILMDIQLMNSEMDGIEVTRAIRDGSAPLPFDVMKRITALPIVFVTAYSSRYSKEDLVQVGGNELVTKPVDFTKLMGAITRLMADRVRVRLANLM